MTGGWVLCTTGLYLYTHSIRATPQKAPRPAHDHIARDDSWGLVSRYPSRRPSGRGSLWMRDRGTKRLRYLSMSKFHSQSAWPAPLRASIFEAWLSVRAAWERRARARPKVIADLLGRGAAGDRCRVGHGW
jgi:hypothetical protein